MKRIIFFLLSGLFSFTVSFGQITGSAHDFSGQSWATGILCGVCHTPHNANGTVANAPLWNHEVTTSSYTLYSSPTLDATVNQPSASSKLCLSCHDGTVALENFGGVTTGTNFITGNALLGTDLSTEHPISFVYNTALATADGELYDPSTQNSGLGSTIANDLLFSGSLECASCHDVHNTQNNSYLLRIDNTGSALCLTCHNK
ncbi:MAG: cytochrome c3 family protein [Chlorobi bacterium]|nr:cytochrome c3 family protein [Chlorobiota bacterium]